MPAKRVILHAGLPKTGTSAIQQTMAANRTGLAGLGVAYWSIAAEHNTALAQLFERPGEEEGRLARRAKKRLDDRASTERSLLDELDACEDVFVVSAESVSSYDRDRLIALRDLLTAGGADCTAVIYVREPRSALTSAVQQRLKVGDTIAGILAGKMEYTPRRRIEALMDVFGTESFQMRAYPGRTLLADFLGYLGLSSEQAARFEVVSANESFSHRAAIWLDAVNAMAASQGAPASSNRLGKLLTEHMPGPRFQLPAEVLETYVRANAAVLDWVSSQLGQDVRRLPSSFREPPEVAPPDPALVAVLRTLARENKTARRQGKADRLPAGQRRRGRKRNDT